MSDQVIHLARAGGDLEGAAINRSGEKRLDLDNPGGGVGKGEQGK